MNEIVNKFFSACGPFTKNKERIQSFKETGDTRYFKDLGKRTVSVKKIKNLILLKIRNMMDIEEGLLLWFTTVLIKSQKEVVLIHHESLMNH